MRIQAKQTACRILRTVHIQAVANLGVEFQPLVQLAVQLHDVGLVRSNLHPIGMEMLLMRITHNFTAHKQKECVQNFPLTVKAIDDHHVHLPVVKLRHGANGDSAAELLSVARRHHQSILGKNFPLAINRQVIALELKETDEKALYVFQLPPALALVATHQNVYVDTNAAANGLALYLC